MRSTSSTTRRTRTTMRKFRKDRRSDSEQYPSLSPSQFSPFSVLFCFFHLSLLYCIGLRDLRVFLHHLLLVKIFLPFSSLSFTRLPSSPPPSLLVIFILFFYYLFVFYSLMIFWMTFGFKCLATISALFQASSLVTASCPLPSKSKASPLF